MSRALYPTTIVCASLFAASALRAQESGQPNELETVTITAQRRSELLPKAPIAVSVISQGMLDARSITAAGDILTLVPNLNLSGNGQGNGFAMRGIGNNSTFSGYSTVAVQVDGIYEPVYQFLTIGLYDIDRIEVLRGPQGTLYGRNATVGVVNIETVGPKSIFESFADVAYGNYRDRTARGVLNLPVSGNAQFRLSAMKRQSDGYVNGGAASRRFSETDVSSVRLAWNWQITPDVRWRASLSRATDKGTVDDSYPISYNYFPNSNLATGDLGLPVTAASSSTILAYHTMPDIAKDRSHNAFRSSVLWWLNDKWRVAYLAGMTRLVNNGVDVVSGNFLQKNKDWATRTHSHEIDVNYESDSLKFVGGIYHYRDRTTGAQKIGIGDAVAYPMSTALPPPLIIDPGHGFEPAAVGLLDVAKRDNGDRNDSDAIFSQVTWSVMPRLRATAGVRHTRDKFSTNGDSQPCAYRTQVEPNIELACGVPFGPPVSAIAASSSRNTSWRLALDHDLSHDHLMYASLSTGYRGGGATANVAPEFLTYKPERLTNIEAGWRARLMDNRVGLNATVFNMNYRDLQIQTIGKDAVGTPTPVTGNAADARVRGLEFEGEWLATRNDRINGYFTYLDAKLGRFVDPVAVAYNPNTYNTFAAVQVPHVDANNGGHRLTNAPRFALQGRYAHTVPLESGARVVASVQVYWQSGTYTSLENFGDPLRGYRRSYSRTDLGLHWESADRRWMADAYVYNLENKKVFTSAVALHAATVVSYMPPRTLGVRLGYRFN
ncbi:MAG TPA: TonB-dependent receptor [Burkholderiaceae bacterium]|nr:TonB-dependent receptor [Burkholderiaceae bacterium]